MIPNKPIRGMRPSKGRGRPEANRLIHFTASDWSEYWGMGMWVPYKSPPNKAGSGRFMQLLSDGSLVSAQDVWKEIESWEYADGGAE